ncbi:MAG: nuclear transport factor 2 family protein [Deltaproteobacteria bacterium]|nr:MAG: nuclear transport factor 2 family protein [Deltaproteobacteria bacterium]
MLKARAELVYCLLLPKGGHLMTRALFWLATIGLAVSSLATGNEPAPAATEAGMPAGLADRVAANSAAVAKRDVAALDDIWTDDYTFINPHGALLTKKQRLENLKSGATGVEATARQIEAVHVYGDTAVAASRITLKGRYSGKEAGGEYRMLSVWVNQQGRWRLAANQLTPIARH